MVLAGRATFALDREEIDAPAGMFVFIGEPDVRRGAIAAEAGTSVLAIGAAARRAVRDLALGVPLPRGRARADSRGPRGARRGRTSLPGRHGDPVRPSVPARSSRRSRGGALGAGTCDRGPAGLADGRSRGPGLRVAARRRGVRAASRRLSRRPARPPAPRPRPPRRGTAPSSSSRSYTRKRLTTRPPIASMPRFIALLVSRIQPISPPLRVVCSAMSKCSMYSAAATPVCWYSGSTPRNPTRTRSMIWRLSQEVPPAERQQLALHLLLHLVDVGDRQRGGDRLAVDLGDHEPVLVEHQLHLLRVGGDVLVGERHEVPVLGPRGVVDLREARPCPARGAAGTSSGSSPHAWSAPARRCRGSPSSARSTGL